MDEKQQKLDALALDVLTLSRNTLLVNLRFLDAALSMFEYVPIDVSTLVTDGKHLFYNARHVLAQYKTEKEVTVRDYLHVVMHCVFRHMFMDPTLDRPVWDLACDIAVENVINELCLKSTESIRQAAQQDKIEILKNEVGMISAEKLYSYFKGRGLSLEELEQLREGFRADDHEMWYMTPDQILVTYGYGYNNEQDDSDEMNGGDGQNDNDNGSGEGEGASVTFDADGQNDEANISGEGEGAIGTSDAAGEQSSGSGGEDDLTDSLASVKAALEQEWKKISERMQMEMETFAKQQGDRAGSMMQNLKEVNREKYDYTAFLKKFAVMGEVMKINDEEFDYVYYTYGLSLYKNLPLIEPLEYKDVKRIREFVIAIDTSGSVAGDQVQTFIQKTYNILKSTESFFAKINLHIVQCDAAVQEHVKITTQEEFDEYLRNMKILGLGGTDFRPVFRLVDSLIEENEFTNLKGLIYFTDGYGDFPARKPDYETAFVFIEEDYNNPDVPPWAIKLVLRKDEI